MATRSEFLSTVHALADAVDGTEEAVRRAAQGSSLANVLDLAELVEMTDDLLASLDDFFKRLGG